MARSDSDTKALLLGERTPVPVEYAPDMLYPIPRDEGRKQLQLSDGLPFCGVDQWYAYELSWLQPGGKPLARVGRFLIPANSPNMVESKSFKLYLNSLNNMVFDSEQTASELIVEDIAAAVGAPVQLQLYRAGDPALAGMELPGQCIDQLPVDISPGEPAETLLRANPAQPVEERLYSHLLRSLCPVTGQPDWASVYLHYRGPAIDRAGLLRYFISYRDHQAFHEQCVERMFVDVQASCEPDYLHVQACYTRRGGLDISPSRVSVPGIAPLPRTHRQ